MRYYEGAPGFEREAGTFELARVHRLTPPHWFQQFAITPSCDADAKTPAPPKPSIKDPSEWRSEWVGGRERRCKA
ncbi:hypothetical protein JCM6882_005608 [Rhodosporidiobolus microsporus]